MKKPILKNKIKLVMLYIFIASFQNLSAQQYDCINFGTLKEDIIDLGPFMKSYDDVKKQHQRFKDRMRYHENGLDNSLESNPTVINMKALIQLFNLLAKDPCATNIRGVKITFGLSHDTVQFYFSPITMTRKEIQEDEISYDVSGISPEMYKYNGTKFIPITTDDRLNIINYADKMRIRRRSTSMDFSELNRTSGDWQEDSKEVIFSFQEILELYHYAYPCTGDPKKNNYDQDLYFYNGVANYRHIVVNRWRRKHTIFIAVENIYGVNLKKARAMVAASQQAANLAHLCPPSCSPIYKILNRFPCP